jgi:hypothetical protein
LGLGDPGPEAVAVADRRHENCLVAASLGPEHANAVLTLDALGETPEQAGGVLVAAECGDT